MKSEICRQTLDLIQYDEMPKPGTGIQQFVLSINKQNSMNKFSTQNHSILYAINAAYSVYLNRLIAISRKSEAIDIQNGYKVKT